MQPDRTAKRENREGAANAKKHAHEISDALFIRQSKQAERWPNHETRYGHERTGGDFHFQIVP